MTKKHLEHIGVPLAKEKENSEFGKFIWIEDPEGRLVELWEKQRVVNHLLLS